MTDKLELRYCCEVESPTGLGANIALYADSTYANFYVNLREITESAKKANCIISTLGLDLCDAVTDKTRRDIRAVNLESIKPRVTAEFFPTELFDIAAQPYPKPLDAIVVPLLIFSTNGKGKNPIEIYRHGSHNLISLGLVSNLIYLTSTPQPPLIEKALTSDIYFDGDYYYADIHDVRRYIGDLSPHLLWRFRTQIFMDPVQGENLACKLHCEELTTVPYDEHELTIYKGAGFGENSFFFIPADLDDILDAHGGIKDMAEGAGTFFAEDGEVYCRLDMAGEIAKTWAAALWDGHNQNNRHIQGAFDFYRWFNKFMPIFIAENVQYTCDLVPFADGTGYEEPAEQPVSYDAFSPKKLIAALAGRLNFKHDDLVDAILELREDLFDEEQDALRSELYDTTDAT